MSNTIDEAIAILQAMKEGKKIQLLQSTGPDKWLDRIQEGLPNFNRNTYRVKGGTWVSTDATSRLAFNSSTGIEWRIKPDPRVIWVHKGSGFPSFVAPAPDAQKDYAKYVEEISDGE